MSFQFLLKGEVEPEIAMTGIKGVPQTLGTKAKRR